MSLLTWLSEQKLSDWVQGLGSLAAAGAAVGIALRQERLEHRREVAAGKLRAQVLAAAIVPVLHDMQSAVRVRNGLLQTTRRLRDGEQPPSIEELSLILPHIFISTIERIDVFGARPAAEIYTLVHRVNDYNRQVEACRNWGVPHRQWEATLRPKLDAVGSVLEALEPPLSRHIDELRASEAGGDPVPKGRFRG